MQRITKYSFYLSCFHFCSLLFLLTALPTLNPNDEARCYSTGAESSTDCEPFRQGIAFLLKCPAYFEGRV